MACRLGSVAAQTGMPGVATYLVAHATEIVGRLSFCGMFGIAHS